MSCVDTFPAPLDITIYQGGTFALTITWESGDPATPVNLTGYTASMKVKQGQTTLFTLTSGDGITLGGTAGTISLSYSATNTALLTPGTADYDLLLTSGTSVVTPLVAGRVTIQKGITAG